MQLTPEERLMRDSYLSKARIHFPLSIEVLLTMAAVIAFSYGFYFSDGNGHAMVFTGFCLSLMVAGRYIYYGRLYRPHMVSLLQKYEKALAEKQSAIEADTQSSLPKDQGAGST